MRVPSVSCDEYVRRGERVEARPVILSTAKDLGRCPRPDIEYLGEVTSLPSQESPDATHRSHRPEGRRLLDAIGGLLGKLGGGGLLDNVLSSSPTDVSQGNAVLGEIFGSKDVSRAVADRAAGSSGLDPSILKKMLPMVAMLATGMMAKQADGAAAPQGGGLGGMLGGLLGGKSGGGGLGGLAAMLDKDGDGNPFDDLLGK